MAREQGRAAAPQEESTTLSTRFTARQREILEQAAGVLNCSPAKLIREATLQRAADVVNASGRANATLRRLAHKALQPMVNPLVDVCLQSQHEELDRVERMTLDAWERMSDDERMGLMQEHGA